MLILPVLGFFGSAASALPVGDVMSGSIPFEYTPDGRTLSVQIDYAVYSASPGDVELEGQYVYAYQIINSEDSDVGIDSFAVGILEGATVIDIAFDSSVSGGGVEPSYSYFSPGQSSAESAAYLFLSFMQGVVQSGQQSAVLLFSSDDAPALLSDGFASIAGGGIGGTVTNLPTPIPEPTTIILLGGSWAIITLTRRRRSV